ncbi:hypothetical protein V502_07086, partial [Pseudogymnoascus sp. VKM F-4520 (FW-2644)]
VVAAGSRAPPELNVGARVVAFHSLQAVILWGEGALAEYVRVPAAQAVHLCDEIDLVTASGMVGCGSTALKMVRTAAVGAGDRVLINGASSSVGSVLVQICKMKGATVVGVASGRNEELFVDYTAHALLPAYLKSQYGTEPFDAILDCAGVQALYTHSADYVKPAGMVINVGTLGGGTGATFRNWFVNTWCPTWLGGVPRRYIMFSTPPTTEAATIIARLIEEGKVRILVDSVWEMEDLVKAYAWIGTKRDYESIAGTRSKRTLRVRVDSLAFLAYVRGEGGDSSSGLGAEDDRGEAEEELEDALTNLMSSVPLYWKPKALTRSAIDCEAVPSSSSPGTARGCRSGGSRSEEAGDSGCDDKGQLPADRDGDGDRGDERRDDG